MVLPTKLNWRRVYPQVRVSVFKDGSEKAFVTFNATSSDKISWFAPSRMIHGESSYTDLPGGVDDFADFSIAGWDRSLVPYQWNNMMDTLSESARLVAVVHAVRIYRTFTRRVTFSFCVSDFSPGRSFGIWSLHSPAQCPSDMGWVVVTTQEGNEPLCPEGNCTFPVITYSPRSVLSSNSGSAMCQLCRKFTDSKSKQMDNDYRPTFV